jgi:ATP-dependent Lon protease
MPVAPTLLSLPLVSLPSVVLPGSTITIDLSETAVRDAVERARRDANGRIAILPGDRGDTADATVPSSGIGVVALVPDVGNLPNGHPAAIVQIDSRARIGERSTHDDVDFVGVELIADPAPSPRVEAAARELRATLELIAELRRSRRLPQLLATVSAPGALADAVATWAEFADDDMYRLLRSVDLSPRWLPPPRMPPRADSAGMPRRPRSRSCPVHRTWQSIRTKPMAQCTRSSWASSTRRCHPRVPRASCPMRSGQGWSGSCRPA